MQNDLRNILSIGLFNHNHPSLYTQETFMHKHTVIENQLRTYILERIPYYASMSISEHEFLDFDVQTRYDYYAQSLVLTIQKNVYACKYTVVDKTDKQTTEKTDEIVLQEMPASLKDWIKKTILEFVWFKFGWKLDWKINQIPVRIVKNITINNIVNHNTIHQNYCPHIDLPGRDVMHTQFLTIRSK